MKFLLMLTILLTGCNNTLFFQKKASVKILHATCYLKGFTGFPRKVSGPVTLELGRLMVIMVMNRNKTERIEITFPKNKCKVK